MSPHTSSFAAGSVPADASRAAARPRVVLLPPATGELGLLSELAHKRLALEWGDELTARERAVLVGEVEELEKAAREAGLVG